MHYKITPQNTFGYLQMWNVDTVRVEDAGFRFDQEGLPDYVKVVPRGTPMIVDRTAGVATAVVGFNPIENVAIGQNKIKAPKYSLVAKDMPLTAGTNASLTVSAIDSSNADYDTLTLSGNLTVAITTDTFVGLTHKSGSGLAIPEVLCYADVEIDDETLVSGIYEADNVVESRLPQKLIVEQKIAMAARFKFV